MQIPKTGSYIFNLESDDGSILWIDSTLIINNDKIHRMILKSDTVYLEKGVYPIKIWYMSAIPDRYGLVFNAKYYALEKLSNNKDLIKNEAKEVVVLNENILQFENNSSEIKQEFKTKLTKFCKQLLNAKTSKIQIIGHTDSKGSKEHNYQLSLNRAIAVKKIVEENLQGKPTAIEVIGMGDSLPIQNNDTEDGRKQNRRVEIKIY